MATVGTNWVNTSGTPVLVAPYSGEYIIAGGAETSSPTNNTTYDLGLSLNGTVVATLSGMISKANHAFTISTSYKLADGVTLSLSKGDILREIYRTDGNSADFGKRWMKITPIRVNADPLDDPEPVVTSIYEGAG